MCFKGFPQLGKLSYNLKVVPCSWNKQNLSKLRCFIVCYVFLSFFQYTPDMEVYKFVTLSIFSLCLVEKSRTDRTISCSSEIQVVETGVAGKLLIILFMFESSLLLYSVYSPVELSRETPLVGRGIYYSLCHISVIVQRLYVDLLRIVQLAPPSPAIF